jgi:hypothetical protein
MKSKKWIGSEQAKEFQGKGERLHYRTKDYLRAYVDCDAEGEPLLLTIVGNITSRQIDQDDLENLIMTKQLFSTPGEES